MRFGAVVSTISRFTFSDFAISAAMSGTSPTTCPFSSRTATGRSPIGIPKRSVFVATIRSSVD